MWRIRLAMGLAFFLTGLVLAVFAGLEGRFWGACGFLVAGVAGSATVILWESYIDPMFWLAPILGAALTIFSVLDVFTSSHAVNSKEIAAQDDFVSLLIHLEVNGSRMSARERALTAEAFKVCALQTNYDQLELVGNAQKAIYLGSTLTLVDGINSAMAGERPLRCLDYYRELRKTQAPLFARMEQRHSWLLEYLTTDAQ